jgi:membrane protein
MKVGSLRPSDAEARIRRAIASLYRTLENNRFTRMPWAVIQTFSTARGALLAGSMAYYTFLSLLPLLMVGGFIVGSLAEGSAGLRQALSGAIDELFPGARGRELLRQLIDARVAFGVFGLLTVAYAGSGFVGALTSCLNHMWSVSSGRNPVGQKLLNLLGAVLLALVLLVSVGLTIWVTALARTVLGNDARPAVWVLDAIASPLSMFGVLMLLYLLLPARSLSWRSQVPGALFGTISIELLKRVFAFWAENSTGVEELPRSLLSVVLLLVWLGFFGQVILYGASLNVVRDRKRRGVSLFPAEYHVDH